MYVSVRDCHLPIFGSIKAGLDTIGIDAVELNYNRDRSVASLDGAEQNESLADRAAIDRFAYKCSGHKIKVTSFLLANNFGADDLESEIDWVISAVKAAGQLGMPAVRMLC
jgi:hypothetical protein